MALKGTFESESFSDIVPCVLDSFALLPFAPRWALWTSAAHYLQPSDFAATTRLTSLTEGPGGTWIGWFEEDKLIDDESRLRKGHLASPVK